MIVIALRDKIEQRFRTLSLDFNAESAKRNLTYSVNNTPELLFKSKDLELYQLGEFDDEKGSLIPCVPAVLICRGDEVIVNDQ